MKRRLLLAIFALSSILTLALQATVQPAQAFQGSIQKVKSDCISIQLEMTLIWGTNDQGSAGSSDFFRLKIYNDSNDILMAVHDEQVSNNQSPWYWQSHRIDAIIGDYNRYRVEVWDINGTGGELRLVDSVVHNCFSHNTWRESDASTPAPVYADAWTCQSWMNFDTTNTAPEAGAITAVWTHGTDPRTETNHLVTWRVEPGDFLHYYSDFIPVPCGVYIRMYFQPDSSKTLYYMPPQVYPSLYGTSSNADEWGATYVTFFPLNGGIRPTMTPFPTETPRP